VAATHGRKAYFQILLDPNRAELAEGLAKEEGVRTSEWIRRTVYKALERNLPSSVYAEAEAQDHAAWRQSVRRRIEGRTSKKKEAEGEATD